MTAQDLVLAGSYDYRLVAISVVISIIRIRTYSYYITPFVIFMPRYSNTLLLRSRNYIFLLGWRKLPRDMGVVTV